VWGPPLYLVECLVSIGRAQLLINAVIVEVESGAKPGRALVRFPDKSGFDARCQLRLLTKNGFNLNSRTI